MGQNAALDRWTTRRSNRLEYRNGLRYAFLFQLFQLDHMDVLLYGLLAFVSKTDELANIHSFLSFLSAASPYLLSLGLSKSLMSIVFLAGPLSGLFVQPLIGAVVISKLLNDS
jgi:hypothetical protein